MSIFGSTGVTFDTSKAASGYQPIPDGEYSLMVSKCEERPTRSGGEMLAVEFTVTAGEYAGRKLFENLNTGHADPEVRGFAEKLLHALMGLLGIKQAKAASDFVGKAGVFKVKVKKRNDTQELENKLVIALKKEVSVAGGTAKPATPKPSTAADF